MCLLMMDHGKVKIYHSNVKTINFVTFSHKLNPKVLRWAEKKKNNIISKV